MQAAQKSEIVSSTFESSFAAMQAAQKNIAFLVFESVAFAAMQAAQKTLPGAGNPSSGLAAMQAAQKHCGVDDDHHAPFAARQHPTRLKRWPASVVRPGGRWWSGFKGAALRSTPAPLS